MSEEIKIQVLGSGCATCQKLYEITKKAVVELGLDTKVEYLTGGDAIQQITEMGVMSSPVIAINGEPVMAGFTDDVEKIKELIKESRE